MSKARRQPEAFIDGHLLSPESLMMSYDFDPERSEGSVKPPLFLTSTFSKKTAR
ncbi:MAG: methionine gamma-lyase, partial [Patescibacteria group bacterium]